MECSALGDALRSCNAVLILVLSDGVLDGSTSPMMSLLTASGFKCLVRDQLIFVLAFSGLELLPACGLDLSEIHWLDPVLFEAGYLGGWSLQVLLDAGCRVS